MALVLLTVVVLACTPLGLMLFKAEVQWSLTKKTQMMDWKFNLRARAIREFGEDPGSTTPWLRIVRPK